MDLSDPERERFIDLYLPSSASTSSGSRGSGASQAARQDPTSIHRLFLDPSGRHIIVSTLSGDNYYYYSGWDTSVKRARALGKFRGTTINAVSWNSPLAQSSSQIAQTTTSTKEILVGDTNGNIYECVIDASAGGEENAASAALRTFGRGGNLERYHKLVYTLPDKTAVTGIRAEIWGSGPSQQKRRAVVLASTSSRIVQFVGTVPGSAGNVSVAERD